MACAGLMACEVGVSSHIVAIEKTRRAVNLALKMKKYCNDQIYGEMNKMKVKIGIHVGKVIAGVIGYHKPQFSLIGDTVNTTSRVCSTAIDGTITISDEAYQKVKDSDLTFQHRIIEVIFSVHFFRSFFHFIFSFHFYISFYFFILYE